MRWDASQEEIQKAYRQKAKILHPDAGGTAEAFGELSQAYEVLSSTERRERYDCTGEVKPIHRSNLDDSATRVIARKLGEFIHAEHDTTAIDLANLIEEAIQADIARCRDRIFKSMALTESIQAAARQVFSSPVSKLSGRHAHVATSIACRMATSANMPLPVRSICQ